MLKAFLSLCRSVSPTTSLLPVSPTASQLPGLASRLRAPGRPGQQQQQSQRGVPVPATLSGLPTYQKRTSLDGDSTPRRSARFLFYFFYRKNQGLQRDIVYLSWPTAAQRPRIWAQMQGEGSCGVSAQLYTGAQINFGDLTPYLTYGGKLFMYGYGVRQGQ
jgi:hypothetical protein